MASVKVLRQMEHSSWAVILFSAFSATPDGVAILYYCERENFLFLMLHIEVQLKHMQVIPIHPNLVPRFHLRGESLVTFG